MQSPQPKTQDSDATPLHSHRPSSIDTAEEAQSLLLLDDEGTIRDVSDRTSDLLDAQSSTLTGQSFFRRVHPRQLNRVLHDLTEMITNDKQQATWLLRLQTDLGPWQWFKVASENRLNRDDRPGIVLRLFERGGRSSRDAA